MKFITNNNIYIFINALTDEYDVYAPVKKGEQRFYAKYDSSMKDSIILGEVRPFEPMKAFFSRSREKVANNYSPAIPEPGNKPFAILGVKACDLKGFKIQDFVFTDHDAPDPFYIKAREENLVISCDCTCAINTCFCVALGIKPFPQEDFDINLSQVEGGYIVESGSKKGETIIDDNLMLFEEAPEYLAMERAKVRADIIFKVEQNLREFNVPPQDVYRHIIEYNFESEIWKDEAKTCVECGACNTICPTCHCFLLYDQKSGELATRFRTWDSCMLKDFARVAGGANPRKVLWQRLRNRFEKKFDFFPKVANVYACTGCGRCVSACPAKIDIRKVLRRLVDESAANFTKSI